MAKTLLRKFRAYVPVRLAELGYEQKDLARLAGRSDSWVSNVMSERNKVNLLNLEKLAEALQLTPHELLERVEKFDLQSSGTSVTVVASTPTVPPDNPRWAHAERRRSVDRRKAGIAGSALYQFAESLQTIGVQLNVAAAHLRRSLADGHESGPGSDVEGPGRGDGSQ